MSETPILRPPPLPPTTGPWGFWATAGFTALTMIGFLTVQTVIGIVFAVAEFSINPDLPQEELIRKLERNGLFLALATCASAILCSAMVFLWIKIRRGPGVRDYLALKRVGWRSLAFWLGFTAVLLLIGDGITIATGKPVVPEYMLEVCRTSVFPPLLWIAIIIAAPVFEEILFRGFLFTGFPRNLPGRILAVFSTSIIWATIHLQYELYHIIMIFVIGIVLGIARIRTGSLLVPIAIHMMNNLYATIQATLRLAGSG